MEIFGENSEGLLEQLLESQEVEVDLKFFPSLSDWLVFLLLVGIKHAVPRASDDDAVSVAKIMARQIPLAGFETRWVYARSFLDRIGMQQATSKIRMELDRTFRGEGPRPEGKREHDRHRT